MRVAIILWCDVAGKARLADRQGKTPYVLRLFSTHQSFPSESEGVIKR